MKTLREIETGKTFKVADIEFVKAKETDKGTIVVTKDCLLILHSVMTIICTKAKF